MRRMGRISSKFGIIIAAALGLTVCALCCVLLINALAPRGHFIISVVDAYTLSPIEGAFVAIPEANLSAITNINGDAFIFGVPAGNARLHPDGMFEKVTVLVKAEGYLPYAMFYASVYPGTVRKDITASMFEPTDDGGIAIVTFIESPDEDFALELFERCTK